MKIIFKILVLAVFITFYSCSDETNVEEQEPIGQEKLKLNFSGEDFNFDINFDSTLLLKYSSLDDLNKNIENKLFFVIDDVRTELDNELLDNISLTLVFSKGEVRIKDIVKTTNMKARGLGNGACPKGSTYLGSCRHNSQERECLSDIISTHLSSTLTEIGDCSQIRVSVGVFSTSVCSISC